MPGQNTRIQQVLLSAERYTAKVTEALLEIDATADSALAKPGMTSAQSAMLIGLRTDLDAIKTILVNVDQDDDTDDFIANLEQVATWAKANAATLAAMQIATSTTPGFMSADMVTKLDSLKEPANSLLLPKTNVPASTKVVSDALSALAVTIEELANNRGSGIFYEIDTGYEVANSISLLEVGEYEDSVEIPGSKVDELSTIRGVTYARINNKWYTIDTTTMQTSPTEFTGFSGYYSMFSGESFILAYSSDTLLWYALDDSYDVIKTLSTDLSTRLAVEYDGYIYSWDSSTISKHDLDGVFIETVKTYSDENALRMSWDHLVMLGDMLFFTHLNSRKLSTLNMVTFEILHNPYPWVTIPANTDRNPTIDIDSSMLMYSHPSYYSKFNFISLDTLVSKCIIAQDIDLLAGPGDTLVTGDGASVVVTENLRRGRVVIESDIALGNYTDTIRRVAEEGDVVTVVERDGEVFGVGRKPTASGDADISTYLHDAVTGIDVRPTKALRMHSASGLSKITDFSESLSITITCHGDAHAPILYMDRVNNRSMTEFNPHDIVKLAIHGMLGTGYAVTSTGLVLTFTLQSGYIAGDIVERPDLDGTTVFQFIPGNSLCHQYKYNSATKTSTISIQPNYSGMVWGDNSLTPEQAVDMDLPFEIVDAVSVGDGYYYVRRNDDELTDPSVEPGLFFVKFVPGQREAEIISASTKIWDFSKSIYGTTIADIALGTSVSLDGSMGKLLNVKSSTQTEMDIYYSRLLSVNDINDLPTAEDIDDVNDRLLTYDSKMEKFATVFDMVVGPATVVPTKEFKDFVSIDPVKGNTDRIYSWIKTFGDRILVGEIVDSNTVIFEWDEATLSSTGAELTGQNIAYLSQSSTTYGESGYITYNSHSNRHDHMDKDFSYKGILHGLVDGVAQEYNGFIYSITSNLLIENTITGYKNGNTWPRVDIGPITPIGMLGGMFLHLANGNELYVIDLDKKTDSRLLTVLPETFTNAYISKVSDKLVFVKDGRILTYMLISTNSFKELTLEGVGDLVEAGDTLLLSNGTKIPVVKSIGHDTVLIPADNSYSSSYSTFTRKVLNGDMAAVIYNDDKRLLVSRTPKPLQRDWVELTLADDDAVIDISPSVDVDVYLNYIIQHQLDLVKDTSGRIVSVSIPGSLEGESVLIKRHY